MSERLSYTCENCKKTSENIVIAQTEVNYYSVNLSTKQWKDLHGDGEVKSQELFCVHCNTKIDVVSQITLSLDY